MSYAFYLKELLRPLGVYNLEDGSLNAAELNAMGGALDGCFDKLEKIQCEMLLLTAKEDGITAIDSLLKHRPVADSLQRRREALIALLRIGGDSFTFNAINDNLAGCGLNTSVRETDTAGTVQISFPDVPGIPDGFEEMRQIIEDIIPCHLLIRYVFWYITWAMMEARFKLWSDVEGLGLTWGQVEKLVE